MRAEDVLETLEREYPELAACLSRIDQLNERVWREIELPWFTDHGPSHAKRVEQFLYQMVPDSLPPGVALDTIEWFVLLAATRLHDLGMQDTQGIGKDVTDLDADDYDRVRRGHPESSSRMIYEHASDMGLADDPELLTLVALVARSHGTAYYRDTVEDLSSLVPPRNLPSFRAELLAALLLMADELDLHNSRARFPERHQAPQPPVSRAHNFRHYFVSHVSVRHEDGRLVISLVLEFSKGVSDDSRNHIERWTVGKLRMQTALIENELRSGFKGQIVFDRAIEVLNRTELGEARSKRDFDSDAAAVVASEAALLSIVDFERHIANLTDSLERDRLVGIGGEDGPNDPSGREDVAAWAASVTALDSEVVVSSELRRGSATDVLEDWLHGLGVPMPTTSDPVTGLLSTLVDALNSGDTTVSLVAKGVDRLSRPDLEVLESRIIPAVLATSGCARLVYTSTKKLTVKDVPATFEEVGRVSEAEVAVQYNSLTSDRNVVDACVALETYGEHKAMMDRLELTLRRVPSG